MVGARAFHQASDAEQLGATAGRGQLVHAREQLARARRAGVEMAVHVSGEAQAAHAIGVVAGVEREQQAAPRDAGHVRGQVADEAGHQRVRRPQPERVSRREGGRDLCLACQIREAELRKGLRD